MPYVWTVLFLLASRVETLLSAANLQEITNIAGNETVSMPATADVKYSRPWPDDVQLVCKELRARRYISDGFCTSIKPIREVVCAGQCLPLKENYLPWWAEFTKYWAVPKLKEWRCVEALTKYKKVQLMCENGEIRTYKIKVVKSCRCKNYDRQPNRTDDVRIKRDRVMRERERDRLNRKKEKGKRKRNRRDRTKLRHQGARRKQRREQKRLERLHRKQRLELNNKSATVE